MYILTPMMANTILEWSFAERMYINPMQLQKIMYIMSCEGLKIVPGFELSDKFSAWKYGPAIASLHYHFNALEGANIDRYITDAKGQSFVLNMKKDYSKLIQPFSDIWDAMKTMTPAESSRICVLESGAWDKAVTRSDNFISLADMQNDTTYRQALGLA